MWVKTMLCAAPGRCSWAVHPFFAGAVVWFGSAERVDELLAIIEDVA